MDWNLSTCKSYGNGLQMASWSLNQFILSWTHFNVQRLNDTDINKCTPKGWPEENEAKACSNTHLDNLSTLYQLLYQLVQIWRCFSTNLRDADLWGWHHWIKLHLTHFKEYLCKPLSLFPFLCLTLAPQNSKYVTRQWQRCGLHGNHIFIFAVMLECFFVSQTGRNNSKTGWTW